MAGAGDQGGTSRLRLLVHGVVQGVGFRPYVFRLATGLGLAGDVSNTPEGVVIEVEGPPDAVSAFVDRLPREAPPLARVEKVERTPVAATGQTGFRIAASAAPGGASTVVPPDVATCDRCLAELDDPTDRRHRYPFINCTDCGPRFTIIEGVPYDRSRTTMRAFRMCEACAAEYSDPATRRFHAEPDACPVCGPVASLLDARGRPVESADPIADAARLLASGRVVAVKGLGGFHLAADARDEASVTRLRRAKQRDAKPFAVMVRDEEVLLQVAKVSQDELQLLRSPARPIVLLPKADPFPLAADVAPGNACIGVMLPYTPLHHLLLGSSARSRADDSPPTGSEYPSVLVMTSANPCDEPIARANDEAVARLSGIADAYLVHDREILARTDDSVYAHFAGAPRPIRRSRGYVPLPVTLPVSGPPVIAVGGDLKNAFCVTRGDEAFLGPHVGDLSNAATAAYFLEAVEHLCSLLEVRPALVAHDAHPDYVSTRLGEALAASVDGGQRVLVQHHHAHVLSCLAEHGTTGPAVGLAMDGTGFGVDGTSWGGEVMAVNGRHWYRLAHLETLPLPGGDAAAREPWRIALAALYEAGMTDEALRLAASWPHARPDMVRAVLRLCSRATAQDGAQSSSHGAPAAASSPPPTAAAPEAPAPTPGALATAPASSAHAPASGIFSRPGGIHRSSSLGRLFDAASAILHIRDLATYEGEAAIALEHAAWAVTPPGTIPPASLPSGAYPCPIDFPPPVGRDLPASVHPPAVVRTKVLLAALARDVLAGVPPPVAAARFHAAVVAALDEVAAWAAGWTGCRTVALSGGSFQNRLLTAGLIERLGARQLHVLAHTAVPSNDGGIALGQALAALMS